MIPRRWVSRHSTSALARPFCTPSDGDVRYGKKAKITIHTSATTPIAVPAPAHAVGAGLLAHWKLLLGLVLLAGLGLRLYGLDSYSLWMDEVESIAMAQRGIAAIFGDRFGFYANQTPWHYLLVWLTIQPIDPATTSVLVRFPSVLTGAL